MEQYTDAQIIEGILHKDSKVVDFIYKRYYGKVERFLIGREEIRSISRMYFRKPLWLSA